MIAKNFLEEILLSPLKSIERYIIIVSVGFVCDKSETSFPRVFFDKKAARYIEFLHKNALASKHFYLKYNS